MNSSIRIGIIGDYDGRPSHLATEEALKAGAKTLNLEIDYKWLSTEMFDSDVQELQYYKRMNGALNAIKYGRENNWPFIGTCGGFQHAVIEFGRNVLDINDLNDTNFNPYNPNDYITALSCSLVGQTRRITVCSDSRLFNIYGNTEIVEKYNCSFGLNKEFQNLLNENGFKIVGIDENDEARIMIIESNIFFVATLFQPQLSSTYENPHPLIVEYLRVTGDFKETR